MTPAARAAALAAALCLAACSGPEKRRDQALFESYPAGVQKSISEGRVEVGFTPEMVEMALGKPERRYLRRSEEGEEEVWAYVELKPSTGIGLGIGAGTGGVSYGGSVSVGGRDAPRERTRVLFRGGRVVAVEDVAER